MLKALNELPVKGKTVLDIGGGIGAITFELLGKGILRSTHIEISSAYVHTFLKESARRNLAGKIKSFNGDFIELCDQVLPADLVILDKVICCYKNYEELIQSSVVKALLWYAYSIPRNVWWVRLLWLYNWFKRLLRGRAFKTYIHPNLMIEKLIADAGFYKMQQIQYQDWLIAIFARVPDA